MSVDGVWVPHHQLAVFIRSAAQPHQLLVDAQNEHKGTKAWNVLSHQLVALQATQFVQ